MIYLPVFFAVLAVIALLVIILAKQVYDVIIFIYHTLIKISAPFNPKAKKWVEGRKNVYQNLQSNFNYPVSKKIWFHCASLGEFEQGRPLIEQAKKENPNVKILLTFYSPSGYEHQKNYDIADYVTYLPEDSAANAKRFISTALPDVAVFVKYEFWVNYINQLYRNKIPVFLIAASFRESQIFFKWYGGFFRKVLKKYTRIFVQGKGSLQLLQNKKITNAEIAFDTRFERVINIAARNATLPHINDFVNGSQVIVAGSTWPADEKIIASAFYKSFIYKNYKLIIAPHNIDKISLAKTMKKLKDFSVKYSEIEKLSEGEVSKKRILIIDNIGLLAHLYRYANICYVGGGFNNGIHNILEAAVYGKPIFIGPKYKKFPEAADLVALRAAFSILNSDTLISRINFIYEYRLIYTEACKLSKSYVQSRCGGTEKIMQTLRNYIE
jgi:3-deoxy-D-manno-octulosonic-acid transferase